MRTALLFVITTLALLLGGCHQLISDEIVYTREHRTAFPEAMLEHIAGQWTARTADGVVERGNEGTVTDDGSGLDGPEVQIPEDEPGEPERFTITRDGANLRITAESEPRPVQFHADEGGYRIVSPSTELDDEGNETPTEEAYFLDFILLDDAAYPDRPIKASYLMVITSPGHIAEEEGVDDAEIEPEEMVRLLRERRGRELSSVSHVEFEHIDADRIRIHLRPLDIEALYDLLAADASLLAHEKKSEQAGDPPFQSEIKTIRLTGDPDATRRFIRENAAKLFPLDDAEEHWFELIRPAK